MEKRIIIDGKDVTVYRLNRDCDTYGSESNVNFTVHDESNDNVKYLFASYDTKQEADTVFDYIVNNPNQFYLEKYRGSWFDSLKMRDYSILKTLEFQHY